MNVALITPWHVKCGIASYSENLANALAELGVDIHIVRLPRFGYKNAAILQNIVDRIPENVDIIHIQEEYGLYQGLEEGFYRGLKALKKPIVTTCHSVGKWEIDSFISMFSDRLIVHNEFCAKHLGSPFVIIAHGCNLVKEIPIDQAKRSLGIDPKIPVVGYVGFISTYKGLETLIEAIVNVPKTALLIAGGSHVGDDTQHMMQLKERTSKVLQGRCQWLGWIPDERLPTIYGALDLVVYPSRFATESGALLMALSHGKACITSRLPPFQEKEKLGALMTFKDVKDLTRKIKRLLKDDEMRKSLEEGARRYCEDNSWGKVAMKHIELYESLVG